MPSRYEREIEELLRKIDGLPPKKSWSERMSERLSSRVEAYRSAWTRQWRSFGPGKMMLASLVLFIFAFWLRANQGLATILLLGALGVFLYAYITSFRRNRFPRIEKRWRGNVINLPRQQPWDLWVRKARIWWATRSWRRRW